VYSSTGLVYYRHPDWLGSSRLASTPMRGLYYDGAYAPFGEPYAQTGTTDVSFSGENQDTVANLYDFPKREYGIQGRWPSPDPTGLGSVSPRDPRTWNRFAYLLDNPLVVSNGLTPTAEPGSKSGSMRNSPLSPTKPGGKSPSPIKVTLLFPAAPAKILPNCFDVKYKGVLLVATNEGYKRTNPPVGYYCSGDEVTDIGNCTLDGQGISCGDANQLASSGAAVNCPMITGCYNISTTGQPDYFGAGTNTMGAYYTYSGPGSFYYNGPELILIDFPDSPLTNPADQTQ
jgi:RHS repeat-associated protein